ncbi:MAG: YidC/Oxa1 family membrane protein insertase [Clostridia bacterium]|nr:YidC/Oxa1 family membrane protein insertase [Clostridia bacterium]
MNFISIGNLPEVSGLTWLVAKIITWPGSIALGIVIFTLMLKLITLVFDYYSRASMRKSSLKMKEMRPELERLQVQYKDNKELYAQKVSSLYKKQGYSMFGSCLPTIITLVIFIIVLNAFQNYSEFQNKENVYHMALSYNEVIVEGFERDDDIVKVVSKNGQEDIYIDVNKFWSDTNTTKSVDDTDPNNIKIEAVNTLTGVNNNGSTFDLICLATVKTADGVTITNYSFTTTNGYIVVKYSATTDTTGALLDGQTFIKGGYSALEGAESKTNLLKGDFNNNLTANGLTFDDYRKANNYGDNYTFTTFLKEIQEEKAADTYYNERESFLWVKNIWKKDVTFDNPMIENKGDVVKGDDFDKLVVDLKDDLVDEQHNGYFILVALTIISTLLTQLVNKNSQKDQMELGTVDGQGAMTQKMMMWMMPIMMAVFAFMYSAAFSIYIITSTLLSLITTICINKIVDYKFNKENKKEEINIVRRG